MSKHEQVIPSTDTVTLSIEPVRKYYSEAFGFEVSLKMVPMENVACQKKQSES